MKERVSKLILFAAKTKLESRTLQLLEFILAFYPNLAFCIFRDSDCMAKMVGKDFFPEMRTVNMGYFRFCSYGPICFYFAVCVICYSEQY